MRRALGSVLRSVQSALIGFLLFNLEGALRFKEAREDGGLAQLGERLPCKQEVSGSIPLISTTQNGPIAQLARAHD